MPPKIKNVPKLRTFLTNAQKLQLKQFWSKNPDLQLPTVVNWVREHFGVTVGRATLYRIYHAPAEAFAGNAQQKKGRRVKFPALERDIVALYKENRRLNGATLSDDALLRAAAELRMRHGVSDKELKLSNGWLHRFKERHAMRSRSQAAGDENLYTQTLFGDAQTVADTADVLSKTTLVSNGTPKRKPRAPPRKNNFGHWSTHAIAANRGGSNGNKVTSSTLSVQDTTGLTAPRASAAAIKPLTYLAAVAVDSVTTMEMVRWKLNSEMAHTDHFCVDNDGVSILRNAKYLINVELQHTVLPPGTSLVIFKVWAGIELLGQCGCSIQSEGSRALSVLQLECMLSAQTDIRVEYHAPGVVFRDSRLVLRLLSEYT